jgi:hypothetical protein
VEGQDQDEKGQGAVEEGKARRLKKIQARAKAKGGMVYPR